MPSTSRYVSSGLPSGFMDRTALTSAASSERGTSSNDLGPISRSFTLSVSAVRSRASRYPCPPAARSTTTRLSRSSCASARLSTRRICGPKRCIPLARTYVWYARLSKTGPSASTISQRVFAASFRDVVRGSLACPLHSRYGARLTPSTDVGAPDSDGSRTSDSGPFDTVDNYVQFAQGLTYGDGLADFCAQKSDRKWLEVVDDGVSRIILAPNDGDPTCIQFTAGPRDTKWCRRSRRRAPHRRGRSGYPRTSRSLPVAQLAVRPPPPAISIRRPQPPTQHEMPRAD